MNERDIEITAKSCAQATPKQLEEEMRAIKQKHQHELEKCHQQSQQYLADLQSKVQTLEAEKKKTDNLQKDIVQLQQSRSQDRDGYENRITDLLKTFERMQQEKQKNSAEIEREFSELRIKQLELTEQLKTKESLITNLQITKTELQSSYAQLQHTHSALEVEVKALRDTHTQEKAKLQHCFDVTNEKQFQLTQELAASKNEVARLTSQVECLLDENDESATKTNDLTLERNKLREDMAVLRAQKEEGIIALEKTLSKIEKHTEEVELENSRLIEELDTVKQTKAFIKDELETKTEQLNSQSRELEVLKQSHKSLSEAINQRDNVIEKLNINIAEFKKEESVFNAALKENATLHTTLWESNQKLTLEVDKTAALAHQLSDLQETYNRALHSEEELKALCSTMKLELNQEKDDCATKADQLAQKTELIENLETELKEKNSEISTHREELLALSRTLQNANESNKQLLLQLEDVKADAKAYKDRAAEERRKVPRGNEAVGNG